MSDGERVRMSSAALRLFIDSEKSGGPVVVLDKQKSKENYYRVSVTFTGRMDDVDEVIALMQEKYPNAGILTAKELVDRREPMVVQVLEK